MLSNHEKEVMDLLWSKKRALTRTEIIQLSPNKTWKASTIHVLINSLLKKGYLRVDGFIPTGTNYGRTYVAAITPEQYLAEVLIHQLPKSPKLWAQSIKVMFVEMLEDADEDDLDELQEILNRAIEQAPGPHE